MSEQPAESSASLAAPEPQFLGDGSASTAAAASDEDTQIMNPMDPLQSAITELVRDVEIHVSQNGWDQPMRLFAIVRISEALERDPGLLDSLDAEVREGLIQDPHQLMAVEQEGLPMVDDPAELLAHISWPESVDGAALVLERLVLPAHAEAELPEDPEAATTAIQNHPERHELRMASAVLREGVAACALRSREHDADEMVSIGSDLMPSLIDAIRVTFEGEQMLDGMGLGEQ